MMNDLVTKFTKIRPASLSSLLKGLKGMNCKWKDLNEDLQKVILKAVAELCRSEREMNGRGIANAILYLGSLELQWNDHIDKNIQKQIMGGIRTYMDFTNQAIANILVG